MGWGVEPAGDQEHAESVVLEVAEPTGDVAAELDDPVDRFGAAVACAVGVEVRQQRHTPAAQCLAEPGGLGNRAESQRVDEVMGEPASLHGGPWVVCQAAVGSFVVGWGL